MPSEPPRQYEVGMAWPLCLPTDQACSQLFVKLNLTPSGRQASSPTCRTSPQTDLTACEVTVSGGGEKLASRVVQPGQDVVTFHVPDILACHRAQTRLQEESEGQHLAIVTVFASKSETWPQPDTPGPASLMLCAPSAVAAEMQAIFSSVCEALLELKDSVAHVTVRDVYGFTHLMGNSSSNRISDVTTRRLKNTRDPRRQLSSPLTGNEGTCAFELDGIFQAPKSIRLREKASVPTVSSLPPSLKPSSTSSSLPTAKSLSSGVGLPHTGRNSLGSNVLQNITAPPWDQGNAQLRAACHTAWHMYFQPLLQELSYVITCVPTACKPGEWDRQTYLDTLSRMASFLQHHCMWHTLSALLAQTERSGIQVKVKGRHLCCSFTSAKEWCSLTQQSLLQGDLSVHYAASYPKEMRDHDDQVNDAQMLSLGADQLKTAFGSVSSWLMGGAQEEDSLGGLFCPSLASVEDFRPEEHRLSHNGGVDIMSTTSSTQRQVADAIHGSRISRAGTSQGQPRASNSGFNSSQGDPASSSSLRQSAHIWQRERGAAEGASEPFWTPPTVRLLRRSYSCVGQQRRHVSMVEDEITTDSSDMSSNSTFVSAQRTSLDSSKGCGDHASSASLSMLSREHRQRQIGQQLRENTGHQGMMLPQYSWQNTSRDSLLSEMEPRCDLPIALDTSSSATTCQAAGGDNERSRVKHTCSCLVLWYQGACEAAGVGTKAVDRLFPYMIDYTWKAVRWIREGSSLSEVEAVAAEGLKNIPYHNSMSSIATRDFIAALLLCCVTAVVCIITQSTLFSR